MKITKAVLLTVLLSVIYYIPQLCIVGIDKYTDLFGKEFNQHVGAVVFLSSLLSYLIVFHFYWKPKPNVKALFDMEQVHFNLLPYLALIALGLGLVGQPIADFDKIIDYYTTSEIKPYTNTFKGIPTFFIYFHVTSLLIAPLFEELFFRKFLFGKLLKHHKVWVSIIVSSLCFSAIHFETPKNLIPTFTFGVIACIIYLKTKNIWYTIAIHFIHNLFSLLYLVYGAPFFTWVYGLNYDFTYWGLFVFGILTTVLGVKQVIATNE